MPECTALRASPISSGFLRHFGDNLYSLTYYHETTVQIPSSWRVQERLLQCSKYNLARRMKQSLQSGENGERLSTHREQAHAGGKVREYIGKDQRHDDMKPPTRESTGRLNNGNLS